ncbi:hypothetical protein HF086_005503 [Spodoptera exigua]|uniref:Ig-like domain-containing protein n=1 Tax=Spodoptera exigua TaxID=7107 RepID=A0A922MK39_SPOEX|nr:hypothetical protein HF086_005503 [Spodoptera exigua]
MKSQTKSKRASDEHIKDKGNGVDELLCLMCCFVFDVLSGDGEKDFECSLSNLEVGWLRAEDQTVLSLNDRVVLSPRYSVNLDTPSTWQLRIRPLRAEDRGCYMCQINTQPSMKWQIGCIDVYVPPDIINEETSADVSAQEMDNVTLICRASGHPPPKITWRREDHEPMLLKKVGSRDFYKGN